MSVVWICEAMFMANTICMAVATVIDCYRADNDALVRLAKPFISSSRCLSAATGLRTLALKALNGVCFMRRAG